MVHNRLQLPLDQLGYGSIKRITYPDGNVNNNFMQNSKNDAKRRNLILESGMMTNMDDASRAEILSEKSLVIEQAKKSGRFSSIEGNVAVERLSDFKKSVRKVLEENGFFGNYHNIELQIEAEYTKRSLNESIHKNSFDRRNEFLELMDNFENVFQKAVVVDATTDKYENISDKMNPELENVYTLLSAFSNEGEIVPVKFTIKTYTEKSTRNPKLYLGIALTKITDDSFVAQELQKDAAANAPLSSVNISIPQLIQKVNPSEGHFLKHIPDSLLTPEQIEGKRKAEKQDFDNYGIKPRNERIKAINTEKNSEEQFIAEPNVQHAFDRKNLIIDIEGENGSYGKGVLLDTDIFEGTHPRNWNKTLSKYVYDNLAGTEITVKDKDGNLETIHFAKGNERVLKEGGQNSHKVIDKLARTKGNTNMLSVVHIGELLQTAKYLNSTDEHSHQWLDENGWEHRTAYVQNRNGTIFETTLNIAKAKDGRKILYALSNTKKVDDGAVSSAQNGRDSLININFDSSLSQKNGIVKRKNLELPETMESVGKRISELPKDVSPEEQEKIVIQALGVDTSDNNLSFASDIEIGNETYIIRLKACIFLLLVV